MSIMQMLKDVAKDTSSSSTGSTTKTAGSTRSSGASTSSTTTTTTANSKAKEKKQKSFLEVLKEIEEEEAAKKAKTVSPIGVSFQDAFPWKAPTVSQSPQKAESTKQAEKSVTNNAGWFQKGLLEDGYDFGDVTKTILGTAADVVEDLGAGIAEMPEKVIDAAASLAPYYQKGQLYQQAYSGGNLDAPVVKIDQELQKMAHDFDMEQAKKETDEFIKKDLYDGKAVAHSLLNPVTDAASAIIGQDYEYASVLGDKADATVQSGGQMLATAGLQAVGVPWFLTTGVTSYGAEMENALNQGATHEEAMGSAAISAAAEVLTEKISGGIKFGGKALDDALTQQIARGISNKLGRTVARLGVDFAGEAGEELLSEIAGNLGSALYRLDEESWQEILLSEEAMQGYLDAMIGGGLMGGVSGGFKAIDSTRKGVDYVSGLTKNEQAVVDKVYKERLAEEQKKGKVTQKQKDALYERVLSDMDKGYITTDEIESALGGGTYTLYKNTVDSEDAILKEYEELGQKANATLKDQARYTELTQQVKDIREKSQRDALKTQLGQEVAELVKGDRLAESYNERARRGEAFQADLKKYDVKQQAVIQKAIDSGILNNTNRTHEFVDLVSKISADKSVLFDFTNNQKLKDSGFAVEGKQVNGYVTKDGITLNIDSKKALETTVGHEITHVLEGTEVYDTLKQTIFDYAKAKGEYQGRYDSLAELYKDVKDADIEGELTADLVGDYLFTDTDFIKNLSTQNRNVFQKIYDEIKYLCKVVTAGSKEARELERVRKAFEDAYREGGKAQTETKYSISETTDGRFAAVVDNDILSKIDTTTWDKTTKDAAKKAASEALKKFSGGIVVDGITRKVNRTSRMEYTRSKYTEKLFNRSPDVFADKMRAAEVADDIVVAATNWQRDGGLKHPRTDDFVDFDHGNTLIVSGDAKYSAEVIVGITSNGDAVLYDVVDMEPATFETKKEESPTIATTQNAIGNAHGDSSAVNVPQNGESVKYSLNELTDDGLTMTYVRVPNQNVQYYGSTYGQNIEPAGEYMSMDTMEGKNKIDGYEYGTIQFKKPLVLEHINTSDTGWKKTVSDMYGGLTGKKLTKALIKDGYDAIVTYDDYGYNEIVNLNGTKLSDQKNGDVKYSLSDSDGRQLTKEQQEYFKDSKVRDENGNLKVMFHGTSKGGFNTFDTYGSNYGLFGTGSYFTESKSIAESYTNKGKGSNKQVYEAYLNITNPMDMDAQANPEAWANAFPDATFPESGTNEEFYRAMEEYFGDEGYAKWEAAEVAIGAIQEMGYDGITHIGGGRVNPDGERHQVYIAFEPEQIKNINNLKPTSDPDIRHSLSDMDEAPVRSNYRATMGEDIALEGIAPTAEESSTVAKPDTISETETIAPLPETARHGVSDDIGPVKPSANDSGNKPVTRKELYSGIIDRIKTTFKDKGFDFDKVLKEAKNLSTWATVDNTPQRVMDKSLGYEQGGILADITVNKVAQNETEGIKWVNENVKLLKDISKQYHIKPGSKESAAAQMYAEGFYVNKNNEIVRYGDPELIQDFRDPQVRANIKGLAGDPRIRKIYDDTLASINESRTRNLYPEIPRLDNYFLHFRAMTDTFSTLGLPFNPNDIRAKDLPTDLNGVTADLKPGQPYFASAMHREGKRTSFDLLGGVERYLNSAKNQIYHIDDIQTLRALRNYIAETYGQATGLEDIDSMSDVEAEERIKQVYGSHLSTFAKFLNEEANVLAGKTALIDRGIEGIIGRRGITFLNTLNQQVGSNMVGYNISSSLTNFLPVAQTFAKTNKFDFTKAFAQTVANKLSGGRFDSFAEDSPVVIRRKGQDRFYQTPWQKMQNPGYALMGMVDDISTELIARTKYNEFTRKGMDSQTAHFETDKWVSRLMGDRSLGQQPQLFNSKMLGLVTKFQLEVRNQLDAQFYDTIQEAKVSNEQIQNGLLRNAKTAAQVASTLTQLAVVQHLFGVAFESVAGYNPAFDIIEVLMTAFGYDDEEDSEDTVLDNFGQGLLALAEDMPYASVFLDGGRVPVSEAIPDIGAAMRGEDEYGNEIGVGKALWEEAKDIAPYYALPGGYGQLKKTVGGLKMFSDDHPIAGSYTDAGNLRFPVEDTLGNRIHAGVFGQYASENARKYFDQEQRTLNPEQAAIFAELDMPIEEYWAYRDKLNEFYDFKDQMKEAAYADGATAEDNLKYKYISSVYNEIYDLYDEQKELVSGNSLTKKEQIQKIQKQMSDMLSSSKYEMNNSFITSSYAEVGDRRYNYDADKGKWYEIKPKNADGTDNWYYQKEQEVTKGLGISYSEYWSNREEYNYAYDKPGRYAIAQTVGGYDAYMEYYDALENWQSDSYISADKDSNGNSISGSRKEKVKAYIEGLDMDYGEKIILYRSVYSSKADKRAYNMEIVNYLNSRKDLSYDAKKAILEELDFKVDDEGYIEW